MNPSFDFSKNNSLDIEINHSVVSDEFWSYVGNKSGSVANVLFLQINCLIIKVVTTVKQLI